MKKILLLVSLGVTTISGVALADFCPAQSSYSVLVGGSGAGTASITPAAVDLATTADLTTFASLYGNTSSCAFNVTWNSPIASGPSAKVSCNLAQYSTFGKFACGGSDTTFSEPFISASGCQGFDAAGVSQALNFVLSPAAAACSLCGLAIYSTSPFAIQTIEFH